MSEVSTGFRMMHTMIRVLDLERSIAFYTELLGMDLLRREDFPGGRFTLAFAGDGPEVEVRGGRADPQLGPGGALR